MDALNSLVVSIDDQVWNILLYLLVGTGFFFSVRTGFIQVRKFGSAWHRVFGNFSLKGEQAGKDGMSSFQALATAIAAQVGTGNIAGCATALVSGGPGAIFWMWIAAFFGMATIYGEAILAQKTRVRDAHGHITGGPAYYIRKAFPNGFGNFLAVFFSVAVILALGFMGNMVQSNSISDAFYTAFGAPKFAVGIAVALISGRGAPMLTVVPLSAFQLFQPEPMMYIVAFNGANDSLFCWNSSSEEATDASEEVVGLLHEASPNNPAAMQRANNFFDMSFYSPYF